MDTVLADLSVIFDPDASPDDIPESEELVVIIRDILLNNDTIVFNVTLDPLRLKALGK